MAWTAPATVTTGDLMTAAFWNAQVRDNMLFLGGFDAADTNQDVNGFTNTSYADLDALSAAAFTNPVAVTVDTGTEAIVTISAARVQQVTSGTLFLSYRVSGASTIASDDDWSIRSSNTASVLAQSFTHLRTGLTAGSNTFELQARVTANSGNLSNPSIAVTPRIV